MQTIKDSYISPEVREEERSYELSVRPQKFDEYIGQERLKDNLRIFIQAALCRGEALDHLLFHGPPGLGKTTLAYIISRELEVSLVTTSGPAIGRPGDLAAILTNLQERDVLFIDEIHRLNSLAEEKLYPAMEDYRLDLIIGQGPSARTITIPLPHFTLVGATTRTGLLTSPLRDRFGYITRLDFYSADNLQTIVERSASILGIKITPDGAWEIARRSRGTPRIANRLLRRLRDFAQVKGAQMKGAAIIDKEVAAEALEMLEVDEQGFDKMDQQLLLTIINKFNGGPVGLETLSAAVNEEKDTIEEVYEPYLIQAGYLCRTPRGRVATKLCYQHFGLPAKSEQEKLW